MTINESVRAVIAGAIAIAPMFIGAAQAQSYPARPIRIVVPLAPGGGTDLVTRVVAQRLGEQLGQSVIVDNRGGGGTVIGTELVARAPADGYTLGTMPAEFTINPSMKKHLPYDTIGDFSCVVQMTSGQYLLSTHPSVPVKTVQQLLALARSRPGQLTFGSSGPGSANHLAGMLFQQLTGTKLIHVPYKSGGQANSALLGGQTDFMFSNTASVISHVRAGRLRAIAATGPRRSPVAPDVPTMMESGVPKFVVTGFYLLIARAGTPQNVVSLLNAEVRKALEAPAVKARLDEFGAEPAGASPEACNDFVRAEIAKWAPVVKASGAASD
jgi:tripartite-type tricarboxylate transporter receptor subunit TctC